MAITSAWGGMGGAVNSNNPALNPDVQKYIYNLWGNNNPLGGGSSGPFAGSTNSGGMTDGGGSNRMNAYAQAMSGGDIPQTLKMKMNLPGYNMFAPGALSPIENLIYSKMFMDSRR